MTDLSNFILGGGRMKKLIQVLIVCGLFLVMGGTASGNDVMKLKATGRRMRAISS